MDPINKPLFSSYIGQIGVLSGLGLGVPFLPQVPLPRPPSITRGLLRFLVGNIGLLAVFFGLGAIEKRLSSENSSKKVTCPCRKKLFVFYFA